MRTDFIEKMLGLLAMLLLSAGLGVYMLHEPQRIAETQQEIIARQVDDAASLYAENCAICHGLRGEGIGATPPLDSEGLRTLSYDDLYKIIARGRYDTAMPAWSLEEGGSLSEYQIQEMVVLIQQADWQMVQDRVVNLGLAPAIPFTTEADPAILQTLRALPDGERLAQGVELYAQYCVACHGADGLGSAIAPPLNDETIRQTSADDLLRSMTYGVSGSVMPAWENTLSTDEMQALLLLLQRWDEVPAGSIPEPDRPVPTTQESLALGADLFAANCAQCHGPEGQGSQRAPALNVKTFLEETNDLAIEQIITTGVPGTRMPAWGDRLSEEQILALTGFIRQWEATAPEVAQPVRLGGFGGPPWMRGESAVGQQPVSGAAAAEPQGMENHPEGMGMGNRPEQGVGMGYQSGADTRPGSLDWRILALISSVLGLSLILILAGALAWRAAQQTGAGD